MDATPPAGAPPAMPSPKTVIRRSLAVLAQRGYGKQLSATIILTAIASSRAIVRTVYPGPLPWFDELEYELIRQAGVSFDLEAAWKDVRHEH